jgi:hypothetical protein
MLSVVETSVYKTKRFFDKLRMTSGLDFWYSLNSFKVACC